MTKQQNYYDKHIASIELELMAQTKLADDKTNKIVKLKRDLRQTELKLKAEFIGAIQKMSLNGELKIR